MLPKFTRISLFVLSLFTTSGLQAQGDLLITPKRIVFDGSKRMEEINLANTGKDSATYSISFVQYKMDDDGKFIPVDENDSTQKFAHKNLRFYPRTVTLGPNEAQSVKVQLLRANELAPGEYRSHLYFRSTETKSSQQQNSAAAADSSISIKLTPVFGITIPMIIRAGVSEVSGKFAGGKLAWGQDNSPLMMISLLRNGNISLYGDLTVHHVAPNGKKTRVSYVKGLAVYVPNEKRNLQLALDKVPGIDYKSGKLQVVFTDQAPKPSLITETEILLQ